MIFQVSSLRTIRHNGETLDIQSSFNKPNIIVIDLKIVFQVFEISMRIYHWKGLFLYLVI